MISKSELKFIRSLKIKKYRIAEKRFLVEGEKNVLEAVNSSMIIDQIFATPRFLEQHRNELGGCNFLEVKEKDLATASSLSTNAQALAVVNMPESKIDEIDESKSIFALDGVQDPGNLGTIIRTMDWFGFDQLLCSNDCVDLYNPKTISATMGSFSRVKIVYCDLPNFLDKYSGQVVGAEMKGDPIESIFDSGKTLIVMGSESHGVRPDVSKHLTKSITIPRAGNAESLNVGVAAGIICHALASH